MSQHLSWITLNSCVYDYINEAELPESKYFKLFHLAYGFMEDVGLDFFYQVKSVKLPINANKTVTLPADFLQYNKLGILNGVGELVPLKYNDKLTAFNDLHPTRVADTGSSNFANYYLYSSPIFFNYWDGDSYGNLYGAPSSYIYAGGFKIDTQNGVILLDSAFEWTNLVLEYTANPSEGEDYYIPMQFRRAAIDWLWWLDNRRKSIAKGSVGIQRDLRHEYFESRRRAVEKYRPFYLDQAYIQNLEASRAVVKA